MLQTLFLFETYGVIVLLQLAFVAIATIFGLSFVTLT
jgi:hypothetical protein